MRPGVCIAPSAQGSDRRTLVPPLPVGLSHDLDFPTWRASRAQCGVSEAFRVSRHKRQRKGRPGTRQTGRHGGPSQNLTMGLSPLICDMGATLLGGQDPVRRHVSATSELTAETCRGRESPPEAHARGPRGVTRPAGKLAPPPTPAGARSHPHGGGSNYLAHGGRCEIKLPATQVINANFLF